VTPPRKKKKKSRREKEAASDAQQVELLLGVRAAASEEVQEAEGPVMEAPGSRGQPTPESTEAAPDATADFADVAPESDEVTAESGEVTPEPAEAAPASAPDIIEVAEPALAAPTPAPPPPANRRSNSRDSAAPQAPPSRPVDAATPARAKPTPDAGPRPAGNQLARARDMVESGRVQDAISLYREVLTEHPDHMKAHNNLGVLFEELGQPELALDHFEKAAASEPENVEVLKNYGSALTGLARYDDADAILKRALRVATDDVAVRMAVGILSYRRGLYAQAEEELQWVCDRQPGDGPAFYYRAEALNRIGRFEEAELVMLKASELMPTDTRPVYTLGHLYDRQGRREEASEMYRRARDLQAPAGSSRT
jgi:tetratricopeptide (TPR) repeat protein